MPTYVMLLNFTEQGVRNIKARPKRADVSKRKHLFLLLLVPRPLV